MSCPTCDHTVSLLSATHRVFSCPRCGTVVWSDECGEKPVRHEPLLLVERLRAFVSSEHCTEETHGVLYRLGVLESIFISESSASAEHDQKLYSVAGRIKTGRELMGSKWQNCEAETIAVQTISACALNGRNHGEELSWCGQSVFFGRQLCGTNNSRGLHILLDDGSLVLEEYTGALTPPDGTATQNGRPLVLRVTESLLAYAASELEKGGA